MVGGSKRHMLQDIVIAEIISISQTTSTRVLSQIHEVISNNPEGTEPNLDISECNCDKAHQ